MIRAAQSALDAPGIPLPGISAGARSPPGPWAGSMSVAGFSRAPEVLVTILRVDAHPVCGGGVLVTETSRIAPLKGDPVILL